MAESSFPWQSEISLGSRTGDRLTVIAKENGIEIMSLQMALEQVRAAILKKRGSLNGILDEFLAERREEARRENEELVHE